MKTPPLASGDNALHFIHECHHTDTLSCPCLQIQMMWGEDLLMCLHSAASTQSSTQLSVHHVPIIVSYANNMRLLIYYYLLRPLTCLGHIIYDLESGPP